jgi:hypothetical protein
VILIFIFDEIPHVFLWLLPSGFGLLVVVLL